MEELERSLAVTRAISGHPSTLARTLNFPVTCQLLKRQPSKNEPV
jgi:hypothetical protein